MKVIIDTIRTRLKKSDTKLTNSFKINNKKFGNSEILVFSPSPDTVYKLSSKTELMIKLCLITNENIVNSSINADCSLY